MNKNWLRRAKEGFMQAVGAHVATEDAEFDCRLRAFTTHVQELQRMKQLMELWLESFEAFCTTSHMLSEQWKLFYSHSPYSTNQSPFLGASVELDRILSNIHLVMHPAVKETFNARCLQPVQSILALVPKINDRLQERRTLLLDYDAAKAKLQKKVAAGTLETSSRKTEKFDETALKYRIVQEEIFSNFSEFEQARPVTLGPELVSFVGCMHSFASVLNSSTSQLLPCVPQAATSVHRISVSAAELIKNPPRNRYSTNLARVPENFRAPRDDLPKTADPLYSRSEHAGGAYGGYTQITSSTVCMEPDKYEPCDDVLQQHDPDVATNSTPFTATTAVATATSDAAVMPVDAMELAVNTVAGPADSILVPLALADPSILATESAEGRAISAELELDCFPMVACAEDEDSPSEEVPASRRDVAADSLQSLRSAAESDAQFVAAALSSESLAAHSESFIPSDQYVEVDEHGFPLPSTPKREFNATDSSAVSEDEDTHRLVSDPPRPYSEPSVLRPTLPVFPGGPRNSVPPPKPPRSRNIGASPS